MVECLTDPVNVHAAFETRRAFEYLKPGNANLQIGVLKDTIHENGIPAGA